MTSQSNAITEYLRRVEPLPTQKNSHLPSIVEQSNVNDQERVPLCLGNVAIPFNLETRHNLAAGTTGAGKSQAIYTGFLEPIEQRGEPAIIIDHSSEFLQRFYRPDIDLIFNPFDARSVKWTVFNELRFIYDFDRLATCIIPDLDGENQDWQTGAQQLLSSTLEQLWLRGAEFRTNERLIWYLTRSPRFNPANPADENTLAGLLASTTSSRLFEVGAERQAAITLGIVSRYLKPLTYIEDGSFSITDWVARLEDVAHPGWLYLAYTDASYSAIRSLFSIMMSFAIQSALNLSESHSRRLHFLLDEFASLEKIDAIADALTKLRKRGGVVTVGIQSTAQLEQRYGKLGAQTLLSCFGNILMLRVADDETAEKLSRLIGDVELYETSYNSSTSAGSDFAAAIDASNGKAGQGSTSNTGSSSQKQIKRAVLPSEFFGLRDRVGFVRIAGTSQVEITSVEVTKRSPVHPAIVPRPNVSLFI